MRYAHLSRFILALCTVMASNVSAHEREARSFEEISQEKAFVLQLTVDLKSALQKVDHSDDGLLLKAAGILPSRDIRFIDAQAIWDTIHISETSWYFESIVLVDSGLLPPRRESMPFALRFDVLRQRLVLRGLSMRSAREGQWQECRALYQMSVAGLGAEEGLVYDHRHLLNAIDMVALDSQLLPPEFAIGYQLATSKNETEWNRFLACTNGYCKAFALAGWSAGCIELNDLERGRMALKNAIDTLEKLPEKNVSGYGYGSEPAKACAETVITQLLAAAGAKSAELKISAEPALRNSLDIPDERLGVLLMQLANSYQIAGDSNEAERLVNETLALLPDLLSTFDSMVIDCLLAEHDVLKGESDLAIDRIREVRSSNLGYAREAAYKALALIAQESARQGLSWKETEAQIAPLSDVESVWARLGWLEGQVKKRTVK